MATVEQTGTPTTVQAVLRRRRPSRRIRPARLLRYAVLIVGAVLFVAPFAYMVTASFQTQGQMFRYPPQWIPLHPTLDNYTQFFKFGGSAIGRWVINSLFVALSLTFLQTIVASLAAYTFAKRRFPFRNLLFIGFIATLMVPYQVTIIPFYLILKSVPLFGDNNIAGIGGHGWLNSYWGLIVPRIANPFSIFLIRQYMLTIPDELLDAARIDGANELTIWWRVVMPLSRPVIAATAIFAFQFFWQELYYPLIMLSSQQLYTLPLGLTFFVQGRQVLWTQVMAGSVLATLPLLILFLIFQRYFVRGIALTGVKG
jgi:multiple sugar transport system permease protein